MSAHLDALDRIAVAARIPAEAKPTAGSPYSSPWVFAGDFHNWLAVINFGNIATDATVGAKLEQAQDDSGTGAKDIPGAALTDFTDDGTAASDDRLALIGLRTINMDTANGFGYLRATVTNDTGSSNIGVTLLGVDHRSGTAQDYNSDVKLTEVVQA